MGTRKRLSLICETPNFSNSYLGKFTKFQGYSLFCFGILSNLLAWRWKTPTPGMNRVNDLTPVINQLEITANTRFLWGGDFNTIFDISLDADGGSPQLYIKSVAKVLSMMSENDLCDIFRIRNPDSRRFTWRRKAPFLQRRLDCCLVSDRLQESIETIDIIPSIASDHSAIILKLRPTYVGNRGRSYWKFNSSRTEDRQFVNSLRNEIPLFEKGPFFSHRSNYEMGIF